MQDGFPATHAQGACHLATLTNAHGAGAVPALAARL